MSVGEKHSCQTRYMLETAPMLWGLLGDKAVGSWDKLEMQIKYVTNSTTLNHTLCLLTNSISLYLREM